MSFSTLLLIVTRLYVKTKASEAFVRTGMGGMKVIQDGGALVVPSIRRGKPEWAALLASAGRLHVAGIDVDWRRIFPSGRAVALPND